MWLCSAIPLIYFAEHKQLQRAELWRFSTVLFLLAELVVIYFQRFQGSSGNFSQWAISIIIEALFEIQYIELCVLRRSVFEHNYAQIGVGRGGRLKLFIAFVFLSRSLYTNCKLLWMAVSIFRTIEIFFYSTKQIPIYVK